MLVALDQEKAYDRIDHEYLETVLKHMGFPPRFYNTVMNLYKGAETMVMINDHVICARVLQVQV